MDTCPIPKLLQKQELLDLRSIALFFNKHYPDEYVSHFIKNRGGNQYERVKLSRPGRPVPNVDIHKPTEENFAIVISPRNARESHEPHAEVHLGKKIEVLFFEAQDSEGKIRHYVELHDSSAIVRITPAGFTIFSADYCKECAETQGQ